MYELDLGAVFEQVGGEGMPEGVGRDVGQASLGCGRADDTPGKLASERALLVKKDWTVRTLSPRSPGGRVTLDPT